MPISLHAALVPSWLQILGSLNTLIDKAEASDFTEEAIVQQRLIDDMLPFAYQVKSAVVHSQGAIEGVRKAVFSPDMTPPPASFAAMRNQISGAIHFLQNVDEAEMEGFIGAPMRFEIGEKRIDFTAENFLLSFSQPNFYFHATTAYDVLRMIGVPVGKLDYLGALRIVG
ncbi:DUF1993 domain-containing protein [Altericroceibacterium endophyticum]|uniref:DUF1993 family protein n=1 Tax=Altericroceibacterium endophyticum TaxID=1808508 RepID=A0A6I4T5W2_9SPHN|nr:DUF1993 domain-containing protein [Altericroceibacterium endophyticum]MXO66286.1 DUF1993 family protein [Altericroceibacterium endophyticum]